MNRQEEAMSEQTPQSSNDRTIQQREKKDKGMKPREWAKGVTKNSDARGVGQQVEKKS